MKRKLDLHQCNSKAHNFQDLLAITTTPIIVDSPNGGGSKFESRTVDRFPSKGGRDVNSNLRERSPSRAAPGKARVPNVIPGNASVPTCLGPIGSIWSENQMTPTQMLDPGSNVATISGPQEEAPAPAQLQVGILAYE
ncbi:hypothetical protein ACFE04_028723 [Oxalis oulophora]